MPMCCKKVYAWHSGDIPLFCSKHPSLQCTLLKRVVIILIFLIVFITGMVMEHLNQSQLTGEDSSYLGWFKGMNRLPQVLGGWLLSHPLGCLRSSDPITMTPRLRYVRMIRNGLLGSRGPPIVDFLNQAKHINRSSKTLRKLKLIIHFFDNPLKHCAVMQTSQVSISSSLPHDDVLHTCNSIWYAILTLKLKLLANMVVNIMKIFLPKS